MKTQLLSSFSNLIDSSGTKVFQHNITSMNIGYLTVQQSNKRDFIDWDYLKKITPQESTEHFVHIMLDSPVTVLMDGKNSISLIEK